MTLAAEKVVTSTVGPGVAISDLSVDIRSTIDSLKANAGWTEPWYESILRAIGEWTLPGETIDGRNWQYVIGGEALDWLTLAQRLATEIPYAIPPNELERLLFRGGLPVEVSPDRFRSLVGPYRYTAHLNFWYGVTVEEALQLAAEEKIRKSRLALCYQDGEQVVQETFRHLYGERQSTLIQEFFGSASGTQEHNGPDLSLTEHREFTYWLFKKRIQKWHPARVASDTRRGLDKLRELRGDNSVGEVYEPSLLGYKMPSALAGG